MNDTEDDARYPQKPYSLNRQKLPLYSRQTKNRYQYEEEEEDEDEGVDDYIEEENDVDYDPNGYHHNFKASDNLERYPKRQRLRDAVSGYQLAPRSVKLSYDWTEHEAFVLLEMWGERFLQLGRRSLRSEDWVEVSEKLTEALKMEKTEEQCRRMMDSLKRKYKKEKAKVEQLGVNSSKWIFFKKMDMLMDMGGECGGLACGVDSGEFVFMDTRVYLDKSNGFDEMRDSPNESEVEDEEEVDDNNERNSASLRMLADSVTKFGEIYEKIESSKREQMMELERMRIDFHRELELQKKQILERTQAEIAKIREGDDVADDDDDDDNDEDTDDDGGGGGGDGDSVETLCE